MLPSSSFSDYSVWRFLLLSVVACRTSQLGSAAAARIEKIHSFVIIQLDILVSYIHIFKGSGIPSKRRKLKINIKAYLCIRLLDYHNSIFDVYFDILRTCVNHINWFNSSKYLYLFSPDQIWTMFAILKLGKEIKRVTSSK